MAYMKCALMIAAGVAAGLTVVLAIAVQVVASAWPMLLLGAVVAIVVKLIPRRTSTVAAALPPQYPRSALPGDPTQWHPSTAPIPAVQDRDADRQWTPYAEEREQSYVQWGSPPAPAPSVPCTPFTIRPQRRYRSSIGPCRGRRP
jgi:hypothetical protein